MPEQLHSTSRRQHGPAAVELSTWQAHAEVHVGGEAGRTSRTDENPASSSLESNGARKVLRGRPAADRGAVNGGHASARSAAPMTSAPSSLSSSEMSPGLHTRSPVAIGACPHACAIRVHAAGEQRDAREALREGEEAHVTVRNGSGSIVVRCARSISSSALGRRLFLSDETLPAAVESGSECVAGVSGTDAVLSLGAVLAASSSDSTARCAACDSSTVRLRALPVALGGGGGAAAAALAGGCRGLGGATPILRNMDICRAAAMFANESTSGLVVLASGVAGRGDPASDSMDQSSPPTRCRPAAMIGSCRASSSASCRSAVATVDLHPAPHERHAPARGCMHAGGKSRHWSAPEVARERPEAERRQRGELRARLCEALGHAEGAQRAPLRRHVQAALPAVPQQHAVVKVAVVRDKHRHGAAVRL